MKNTNLPGFNAESSLSRTRANYNAISGTTGGLPAAAVVLARATEASVDCGTFPDNITCNECNSSGPGTFNCCELKGMRHPGDSCIILNDPNPLTATPPVRVQRAQIFTGASRNARF